MTVLNIYFLKNTFVDSSIVLLNDLILLIIDLFLIIESYDLGFEINYNMTVIN